MIMINPEIRMSSMIQNNAGPDDDTHLQPGASLGEHLPQLRAAHAHTHEALARAGVAADETVMPWRE